MLIHISDTPEELAERAAALLLETLSAGGGGAVSIALSGGSTPKAMYELLAAAPDAGPVLAQGEFFFGDERSVPNDHADSNVRLAREGFLGPLEVPGERIHAVDGGADDLAEEAARYGEAIRAALPAGQGGVPVFDLIFLGMGEDGHTASLFPGTKALGESEEICVANDVPQLDTRRLTLTFPVLNAARHRVVLCAGQGKAEVLRDIFRRKNRGGEPVFPIEHLEEENLLWMLDRAAASEIPVAALQKYAK